MITTRLIQRMITSCIAMLLSQLLYASTLQDVRQKALFIAAFTVACLDLPSSQDQGWQGLESTFAAQLRRRS